jgi:head-tail adaptor
MSGELAGALRERVRLETRLSDRDAQGGATGKYSYDGEAWAAITPLIPADLTLADAMSARPRWQVTLRKREGLGMRTRLTWRGRYLAVRSLLNDPREPAQLVLTCEEVR